MIAGNIRIGNWLKHEAKWSYRNDDLKEFQFQWGDRDWYALGECTLNLSDISPIPLTPKILKKCLTKVNNKEFKIEIPVEWSKTHHTDYWFIVKFYEYYATGESHTGWRPYIKKGKEPVDEIFLWGYIETLHQLQNLYYALTQTELIYTPVK